MTDAINSHSRRMYNAQKKTRALVWQRNGDHHAGGYGYVIRKMGSRYTLTVRNNHGQNFDTIEAAKAAAQAHHDATILAALEPDTPLNDPRVLALVEAATELEKQAKKAVNLGAVTGPHWTHLGLARMKMAIALSALEGRT